MTRQGFAWWAFEEEEHEARTLLESAWSAGMRGIDFLPERHWAMAKDLGYELLTLDGHASIDRGLNDRARRAGLIDELRRSIDLAHDNGARFVSVASGVEVGVSDPEAVETMAGTISAVVDHAADSGVSILIEPLNSRHDHPGHQCDTVEWARDVIERVASPALLLLFDVYHVQLMQGDISHRLRASSGVLGHVHTAGAPGRAEIGSRQEINYAWVAGVLREIGYAGWVVHEFTPTGGAEAALREAHSLFAHEI